MKAIFSASNDYDHSRLTIFKGESFIVLTKEELTELYEFLLEGSRFKDIRKK